jgi:hypothetical protein
MRVCSQPLVSGRLTIGTGVPFAFAEGGDTGPILAGDPIIVAGRGNVGLRSWRKSRRT